MKFPRTSVVLLLALSTAGLAAQRSGSQQGSFRPPVWSGMPNGYETAGDSKHEFAWSRLRYTPLSGGGFSGFGGGYRRGGFGTWGRDYPKADIVFLAALRRLT